MFSTTRSLVRAQQLGRLQSTTAQASTASKTSPRATIWSFMAVLGFALPYFIYSKRANEQKKKDRLIAARHAEWESRQ